MPCPCTGDTSVGLFIRPELIFKFKEADLHPSEDSMSLWLSHKSASENKPWSLQTELSAREKGEACFVSAGM